MVQFHAENLSLAYDDHEVIRGLSTLIPPGQITALIGPNGSGKSTLLKGLARLMKPAGGAVYLDGQAIHRMPTRAVARRLAVLSQRPEAPDGLLVRELVAFGRFPHQGFLGICTPEDDRKIEAALEITGMSALANRALGELSGGQRQLAWIAMALAQDTSLLLLDEPTTFLDMAHQLEVLEVLERLHQRRAAHDRHGLARHQPGGPPRPLHDRAGRGQGVLQRNAARGCDGSSAGPRVRRRGGRADRRRTGAPFCIPLGRRLNRPG